MSIFIELSNPIHGGEGWELGEVLWSPVSPSWNNIMRKPRSGDLVLHSVKNKKRGLNHRLTGVSIVANSQRKVFNEPPIPGRWAGYESYYQIPLEHYRELEDKIFLQEFLDNNTKDLEKLIPQKSFYTESGKKMQPAQKYLAEISDDLYELLKPYIKLNDDTVISKENKENLEKIVREGEIEVQYSKNNQGLPERVKTVVNRIVRDTALIKEMKHTHNNKCQICGSSIKLPNGKYYSEGHHLKKLGGSHQGPDVPENIIILCSNHHVEFDYGVIAIDPNTKKIIHRDKDNMYYNKNLAYIRNDIGTEFLEYHLKEIFIK